MPVSRSVDDDVAAGRVGLGERSERPGEAPVRAAGEGLEIDVAIARDEPLGGLDERVETEAHVQPDEAGRGGRAERDRGDGADARPGIDAPAVGQDRRDGHQRAEQEKRDRHQRSREDTGHMGNLAVHEGAGEHPEGTAPGYRKSPHRPFPTRPGTGPRTGPAGAPDPSRWSRPAGILRGSSDPRPTARRPGVRRSREEGQRSSSETSAHERDATLPDRRRREGAVYPGPGPHGPGLFMSGTDRSGTGQLRDGPPDAGHRDRRAPVGRRGQGQDDRLPRGTGRDGRPLPGRRQRRAHDRARRRGLQAPPRPVGRALSAHHLRHRGGGRRQPGHAHQRARRPDRPRHRRRARSG